MPAKAKKKSTKGRKSKSAAAKAKVEAPAPPVVKVAATPTPAVVKTKTEGPTLNEAFAQLLSQLGTLRSQLTSVTGQVRALQKRSDRELKNAHKQNRKRQRKAGNRAPSGFVKPTKISKELASFLGKPLGTEMARTEVTREINTYIRAHNLQDPKNGRRILADTKLRKLLKLKKDDELTYFNLQRYMSPHFAKNVKKVVASS